MGDRPWLVPILVDCVGRDGSTLLMRLLATSPQVAVEGPYPFERKYFSYIWRWSRVVDRREWPADRWGPQDLVSLADEPAQPLVGPPPWIPRALIDDRGDPLSRRCFEFAWGEFSRRAAERTAIPHRGSGAEVRYYAEKHLRSWRMDPEALDLARLIVMLRDPRDMYVSAAAFTESRGDTAFGRLEFDAPDHLRKFVTGQRRRLQWIASLTQDCQVCLVAYEDLVRDLEGVARRLSEWLGIDLDPAAAGADERIRRMHVTAGDPERSIGRWKAELPASTAEVMRRELGPQLEALGFEV